MPNQATIAALILLASMGCAAPPPVAAPAASASAPRRGPVGHVIVITIDGLVPDAYVHPDAHGLKIPVLRDLVARGASSDAAQSVFPTLTYPAHTSIASGMAPRRHGIISNAAFDPLEENQDAWRWYDEEVKVPRIWDVARDAGYSTALIDWPVTVGEQATFHVPEVWRAKVGEDLKLIHALSTPGLLDAVAAAYPGFTQGFQPVAQTDEAAVDIAEYVLTTARPHLTFLHIWQVDAAQHRHGLWSDEGRAAIENADRQLGRVLAALERAGIARDTALVVASDHGFTNVSRCVNPNALLRQAGLFELEAKGHPREWQAAALVGAASAYVYLQHPEDATLQAATLKVFEDARRAANSGIGRILRQDEIRAVGGDPAAFLALEAELGTYFGGGSDSYETPATSRATHGYDPSRPEMKASLILFGDNVPQGKLESARLVDIAPTVAGWLGLELTGVDGKPLAVSARQ